MAKEKKELSKNSEVIDIKKFMLLDSKEQDEELKNILDKMYEGNFDVDKKHIEKALNIAFDNDDTEIYLPNNLQIKKDGNKLYFSFHKKNNTGLVLLFLLVFLFIAGFATYTGVNYLKKASLNRDLDGDGIADLNIDLNDDGICDVNCDTDKDDKPDQNIDYHGNRKAIFNILQDDGSLFNKVNQDIDGDGVCDINCDTTNDGWPDLNIDFDGDGIIDLDRDINSDGIKDLDIDINGDGVCDINCDEDKDNICDKLCSTMEIKDNGNGFSSTTGNDDIFFASASLVVVFNSVDNVSASMIYPDDQVGVTTKLPDLTFTVENTTDTTLYYDINWVDIENTYESNNFWIKVTSTNSGYQKDWSTAPFTNEKLASKVAIAPRSKQLYTISFTLHGTGTEQNYDQGKTFKGKVTVDLIEQNS